MMISINTDMKEYDVHTFLTETFLSDIENDF